MPLARVDNHYQDNDIYYYHTDQIGTPLELTNEQGEIVWQANYKAWGEIDYLSINKVEQNLRYQGQYFDQETGLHYNTFWYYDPQVGRFTTQDPIRLAGGVNLYQYAPNPQGWADPQGLSSCKLARAMEKSGMSRPKNTQAHHIVPEHAKRAKTAQDILKKHGIDINDAANGVFLPSTKNTGGLSGITHNGSHPHKYIDAINDRLTSADQIGGKQGVLKELGEIRKILSEASNDASWYNIL